MIVVPFSGMYRTTRTDQCTSYTITLPFLSCKTNHSPAMTIHTAPLSHTAAPFATAVSNVVIIIPSRPKSAPENPIMPSPKPRTGAAKTSTEYVIKTASPACCVHERRQLNASAAPLERDTGATSINMPVIRAIRAPVRFLPPYFVFTRTAARIGPGIAHSETYRYRLYRKLVDTVVAVTAETPLLERYKRR